MVQIECCVAWGKVKKLSISKMTPNLVSKAVSAKSTQFMYLKRQKEPNTTTL